MSPFCRFIYVLVFSTLVVVRLFCLHSPHSTLKVASCFNDAECRNETMSSSHMAPPGLTSSNFCHHPHPHHQPPPLPPRFERISSSSSSSSSSSPSFFLFQALSSLRTEIIHTNPNQNILYLQRATHNNYSSPIWTNTLSVLHLLLRFDV